MSCLFFLFSRSEMNLLVRYCLFRRHVTHLQFSMLSDINNTYASNVKCTQLQWVPRLNKRAPRKRNWIFSFRTWLLPLLLWHVVVFFYHSSQTMHRKRWIQWNKSWFSTFHCIRVSFVSKSSSHNTKSGEIRICISNVAVEMFCQHGKWPPESNDILIFRTKNGKWNDGKGVKSKANERFHHDHVSHETCVPIFQRNISQFRSKENLLNGHKIAHRWAKKTHRWIECMQIYKLTNVDPIAGQFEFKCMQ